MLQGAFLVITSSVVLAEPGRGPPVLPPRPPDRRMSAQAEGSWSHRGARLRDNAVVLALRDSPQALFGGGSRRRGADRRARALDRALWRARARRRGLRAPSSAHWLGLDDGGFDMLSLMMFGTRVSLIVGFAAALVAMLIGGAVGVFAGFFGGRIDTLLMRITDYFIVIPDIPLMIVVAASGGAACATSS